MTDMISEVNIINRKVSTARVNELLDAPGSSAVVSVCGSPYENF